MNSVFRFTLSLVLVFTFSLKVLAPLVKECKEITFLILDVDSEKDAEESEDLKLNYSETNFLAAVNFFQFLHTNQPLSTFHPFVANLNSSHYYAVPTPPPWLLA